MIITLSIYSVLTTILIAFFIRALILNNKDYVLLQEEVNSLRWELKDQIREYERLEKKQKKDIDNLKEEMNYYKEQLSYFKQRNQEILSTDFREFMKEYLELTKLQLFHLKQSDGMKAMIGKKVIWEGQIKEISQNCVVMLDQKFDYRTRGFFAHFTADKRNELLKYNRYDTIKVEGRFAGLGEFDNWIIKDANIYPASSATEGTHHPKKVV